ncbi:MAG: hypothetical protein Q4F11_04125 [Eubacteriales bacterium]|nr:hypothetical protein [Eubacteriales bacterium]
MKAEKTYYYSDELNDEFSGVSRETVKVDGKYQYIHKGIIWRAASFIIYRIIMTPAAYIYMKCKFNIKIVNRRAFKQCKKEGFFLYGNHTQMPGDGYLPTLLTFPKRDYVVVNADNISLKGTKTFMEMIGAFTLPNHISGMKNFVRAMKYRVNEGNGIVIYPEAHIWPYYTGIRPFTAESFAYPVMFNKPVFSFTVTYHKRKKRRQPVIKVYVDGPLYPKKWKKQKEAQKDLRDAVYDKMCQRAKNSSYIYVNYIKKENEKKD